MQSNSKKPVLPIEHCRVSVYKIPTEQPESDGTLKWHFTVLVLVEISAGNEKGIGYTYADSATAEFVKEHLFPLLEGEDAMDNTRLWDWMFHQTRNLGRPGITSMAISAVDAALWDLKAKFLQLPLCKLLGQKRHFLPVYASGGFTSYGPEELAEKFSEWKARGHHMFKMKIGRNKPEDLQRIQSARQTIGEENLLFVDANGAYSPKEAIAMAAEMKRFDVRWFEEPVTSDDPEGLKLVRMKVPAETEVAAGEYAYTLDDFRRFLEKRAVDVLQADATRCGGITGFLKADTLCEAWHIPLSAHCAPALHLHVGLSSEKIRHAEYFRDHVRIENKLFEDCPVAKDGKLWPNLERPGLGLEFKFADAEKYEIA